MDNKFSLYRKIRQDRTYRTLGTMSLWRVALGSLLLLSILFITGIVSRPFVARGDFRTARTLLLFPSWMETYHPEDKAYLDAGVLYQDGDYEAALEAFREIKHEGAPAMRSRAALKLAEEKLAGGDEGGARSALTEADASLLTEAEAQTYAELCAALDLRSAA